jgi:hypothetical protein
VSGLTSTCGHAEGAFCSEDIHGWFELSYSSYLVLQRSLMQTMPPEWQHAFVELLEELREAFPSVPGDCFMVKLRADKGQFVRDPLANYRYPDAEAIEAARNAATPPDQLVLPDGTEPP